MNEKILVVEDNVDICRALHLYLTSAGYEVELCHDGLEGLKKFNSLGFDLGIIDLMLPGVDGIELITAIRNASEMPILILSAKSDELDKIEGLSVGADDYITKPFSPPELLARVKSALRRWHIMKTSNGVDSHLVKLGDLTLNTSRFELSKGDEIIELTAKQYKIIRLFMEHPKQIFSKRQIGEYVSGDYYQGDDNVITVHISHIRDKIGLNKQGETYIKTIRGLGYKIEE